MANISLIKQIQSSNNSSLVGIKIRFKACAKWDHSCCSCPHSECEKTGNYDLDGWRYDTIHSHAVDLETTDRIMTSSLILLRFQQIDFYTFEVPDEGPMAIL